jgi:hypothetical protein
MTLSLQEQVGVGALFSEVFTMCLRESDEHGQVVGEDNKRYVTLQQLECILRVVAGLE